MCYLAYNGYLFDQLSILERLKRAARAEKAGDMPPSFYVRRYATFAVSLCEQNTSPVWRLFGLSGL